MATITHHGGTPGVTGSCHRLTFKDGQAVLIDCGLLQGDDRGVDGAGSDALEVTFDFSSQGKEKFRALRASARCNVSHR